MMMVLILVLHMKFFNRSVNLIHRIFCILENCVKSNCGFCIFFVAFDVGKHRITALSTGKCVEVNLAAFILTVLIKWEKCDIFLRIYRENGEDRTFYLCIVFHGKGDCLVVFNRIASAG